MGGYYLKIEWEQRVLGESTGRRMSQRRAIDAHHPLKKCTLCVLSARDNRISCHKLSNVN